MNELYSRARSWSPPRDPLVLDLDGDGIEAVGIDPTRPILFDHDGDGVKNATGWIKGDDGIVVLDRNCNGLIDSGRELFGDQTLRGGTAQAGQGMFYANGYEALTGQDGNGDGVIDAADTAYGQLRIWKDVNQDGISQAGELHTLSDLGIARLNVKGQRSSIDLGNGNTQPWSGSFTRMDGSQGMSGVAEVSGSLLLASNNFYREFPDDPVPNAAAQALPQMGGAGWARDLREAMSLGNDKSQALQEKVQAFAAGTTRDAQMAAVDGLITEWARSSGKLVETLGFHSLYFDAATHQWDIATPDTPIDPRHLPGTEGTLSVDMPDVGTLWTDPATGQQRPLTEEDRTALYQKLNALEVFNGTRFVTFDRNVRSDSSEGGGGGGGSSSGSSGGGGGAQADMSYRVSARLSVQQMELLAQSYEQLRESVYGALVTQTRLRPYLDSVELVVEEKGVRFDTSALSLMLEARKGASERDGLIDLVELIEYQGPMVGAVGFDGVGLLSRWIESLPADAPLRSELTALRVFMATATAGSERNDIYLGDNGANSFSSGAGDDWLRGLEGNDHLAAGNGNDVLEGGAGDDWLHGQAGNDRLLGGEGADVLQGGDGDDVLEGGAGNDILAGGVYDTWNGSFRGTGNDTYLFGRGDGQDTIYNDDAANGHLDRLVFKAGIKPADVQIERQDNELVLRIAGSDDHVRVMNYFLDDAAGGWALGGIGFEDDAQTLWSVQDVKLMALQGTAGGNRIVGYASDDTLQGLDGNDTLEGRGGNDLLEGGTGNDWLHGQAGNDRLLGGEGADVLQGGDGDDVLEGGAGNDILAGGVYDTWNGSFRGTGNDTYLFGRGDGQDTIYNDDAANGHLDKLVFKAGIKPADVQIERQDNELVLRIAGSDDQVRVMNYFLDDAAGGWALGGIGFEDDAQTLWSVQDVKLMALQGTAGGNRIVGYASDDTLQGLDGNDTLEGRGGNDLLEGGAGNDWLHGQAGNDRLLGGEGADVLQGGDGDDVLEGGAGNDILAGGVYDTWNGSFRGTGNDTYLFGRGDGQDTIYNDDAANGHLDRLVFKAGIKPSDVQVERQDNELVLRIAGSDDHVRVMNYFLDDAAGGWALGGIGFEDDAQTLWSVQDVKLMALQGTAGGNRIVGYASDDTLQGLDGNDTLEGRGGNDLLEGGTGNDWLHGQAGNDRLLGGEGADVLQGGDGDDVLEGGAGNDILAGGVYDTWNGSFRGTGNDTYLFGRGDGQDTIYNDDAANGHLDRLVFKAGIKPSDVQVERQDNELVLRIAGSDDHVRVMNYFLDDAAGGWALGGIGFEDDAQTLWSVQDVKLMALQGTAGGNRIVGYASDDTLQGLDGNDTLEGRGGNDLLEGGAGNDWLHGQAGNDRLLGGEGADVLQGGDGDDVLEGGAGNDILAGGVYDTWNGSFRGTGNDTYLFSRGSQADRIVDEDSTPGNVDVLSIGPGVATDQLWFRREGNDLEVSIIGTEDRATIANWYAGSANHLEKIQTSDGKVLLDSQVDALVSAMAAFAPPAAGQTTLPPDYRSSLSNVIATNWT